LAKAIEIDTQATSPKTITLKKTYPRLQSVGTSPAGFGDEMTE
jgi:hypothetical protein